MKSIYFDPPSGWERLPLKAMVDGPSNGAWGEDPGEGEIDVLCARVADFDWDRLALKFCNPTYRSVKKDQFNRLALKPGDLLIEKSGGGEKTPVGRVVAFEGNMNAITSNFVAFMRPKPEFHPSFVKYLFAAHYISGFTIQFVKQATGIQNLDDKPLMQSVAWVPDFGRQAAIAEYLEDETLHIDNLVQEKIRFLDLLREKRVVEISHAVRRGLDPNVSMKPSGVEWRGVVPDAWTRTKHKALFKQVKRQGYEHLTVLSVYRDYGVIEKSSRDDNINKTPENLSSYQLVEPGDLVINKMKAWQGSMGLSDYHGITSPDYVVMTPRTGANPRYLHHYLRARPMPWVYRQISNGIRTDQWRLEPEKFLDLPIFLPSLEEQARIADAIDREMARIDAIISETERSIALLKEKRSALITAAVTGKIDVRSAA